MSNVRKTVKNRKRLGNAVEKKQSFEDNYVLGILVKRAILK